MSLAAYLGTVLVGADFPMRDIAQLVSDVFGGFNLQEGEDRFDYLRLEEVEFYFDRQDSVDVEVSESSLDGYYILTICCVDVDTIAVGKKIGSPFISGFPVNQLAEANGYVNISQYTSDYISSRTTLKCKPAWIT